MADRTLTINHADGGSETYTINRDKFAGVRNMIVDGAIVSIDHTEQPDVRTLLVDGETITIDTTREGVRTLTVDGVTITIDRTDESKIKSFIEQFTAPAAAYSLRDLASTAGNTRVVRVRRSSDNQEADFTAAEVSNIATWVGAGNDGFVSTWYDQSGNGNDATQPTTTAQPKIVDAGSLLTLSGKPTIKPDGTNDFLINEGSIWDTISNSALSCFTLTEKSSVNSKLLWAIGSSSGEDGDWLIGGGGAIGDVQFRGGRISSASSSIGTSGTVLLTALDVSGGDGFVNGTALGSPISTTPNVTADRLVLFNRRGSSSTTTFTNQAISEVIFYASDESSNRTAIEDNINDHYNIY